MSAKGFVKTTYLSICDLCNGVVVEQLNGPMICSSCNESDPPRTEQSEYEYAHSLKIIDKLKNPEPKDVA